jgi:hypothetical protein
VHNPLHFTVLLSSVSEQYIQNCALWYCLKALLCSLPNNDIIFFVSGSELEQISTPPSRNAVPDPCNLQSYEDWKRSILEECDNVES